MTQFKVPLSKSLIKICEKAIINLGYTLINIDYVNNTLSASSDVSLISWGSDIDIRVKNNKVTSTIMILSKSKMALEINFGKNGKIEQTLFDEITNLFKC